MRTGELDRRLTFQEFDTSKGSSGQKEKTYVNISTTPSMYCKVEFPVGSGEDLESSKKTATTNVTFTVRWRSDITEKMRIVYENENYDIMRIAEGKIRRTFLIITAKKKD